MRPHFSPTYRVPSGTSRAKSEVVFSDLFRRKLRDGRSRKDRAERGRHHAKGTRYVGELFGRPVGSISCHSVTTTPTGLARAPRRKPRGAEAQTGPRHDIVAASRWRSSWEAGCQQLTAEMGVND